MNTQAESNWRAPDFLLSLAVHAIIVGIIALVSIGHVVRDTRRPIVFSVSMVSGGGSPLPQTGAAVTGPTGAAKSGASLVENKPRSQAKGPAKTPGKAQAKSGTGGSGKGGMFRRNGLGANIEGAEALGYSYYLNSMLTRISDNWLNPYAGGPRVLTATVVFTIERDGTIKDVKIEKKSGDATYDASCERSLLVTDKLPPLPPEFPGPQLKLHLEFEQKP
jgi:TonB family protein